ncbi:MAG: Maf family protein [Alphaproteobacteria bacterium]
MSALILASVSQSRRTMLAAAGVSFSAEAPGVDEEAVKDSLKAEAATPAAIAETLAELKARKVSLRHPDAFVIGADQVLDCDGTMYDKPPDMAAARRQLQSLRGRAHRLTASVVVARGDARLWHRTEVATLHMRPFTDAFLDGYLGRVGEAACRSVGAYQLEGLGAQLFTRVEGDYFTILGLPLLPLLDFLRGHKLVEP